MRIGVFGDSFAARQAAPQIWWQVLKTFGHDVECFGEPGSSIAFSAKLIEQQAKNFDLVIWCVTTPGRFSIETGQGFVHTSGAVESDNYEAQQISQAVESYRKYLFDWEAENLSGKAVVTYLELRFKNIMVIPSFPPPIYTYPDPIGFNLYILSEQEAKVYFPEKTLPEIYEKYHDLRPAHLTAVNNYRLAELVNQKLKPGLFQTSYDNFDHPTESLEEIFELRQ